MTALPTDLPALARLFVALPCWEWRRGMRAQHVTDFELTEARGTYLGLGSQMGDHCIQWDDHAPRGVSSWWSSPQNFRAAPHIGDDVAPDLTDPATLGAILGLLRERAGDPLVCMHVDKRGRRWVAVNAHGDEMSPEQPTEPHALYAALAALETT